MSCYFFELYSRKLFSKLSTEAAGEVAVHIIQDNTRFADLRYLFVQMQKDAEVFPVAYVDFQLAVGLDYLKEIQRGKVYNVQYKHYFVTVGFNTESPPCATDIATWIKESLTTGFNRDLVDNIEYCHELHPSNAMVFLLTVSESTPLEKVIGHLHPGVTPPIDAIYYLLHSEVLTPLQKSNLRDVCMSNAYYAENINAVLNQGADRNIKSTPRTLLAKVIEGDSIEKFVTSHWPTMEGLDKPIDSEQEAKWIAALEGCCQATPCDGVNAQDPLQAVKDLVNWIHADSHIESNVVFPFVKNLTPRIDQFFNSILTLCPEHVPGLSFSHYLPVSLSKPNHLFSLEFYGKHAHYCPTDAITTYLQSQSLAYGIAIRLGDSTSFKKDRYFTTTLTLALFVPEEATEVRTKLAKLAEYASIAKATYRKVFSTNDTESKPPHPHREVNWMANKKRIIEESVMDEVRDKLRDFN